MKLVIENFQKHALTAIGDLVKDSHDLSESQHQDLFGTIVLNENTDPDRYGGIDYKLFRTVWDDPVAFPSYADMYDALHPEKVNPPKDRSTVIKRALKHFKMFQSDMSSTYDNQQDRMSARLDNLMTDEAKEARSGKNINPGSKGSKENPKIQKINDSELFPGKFYTDRTKIPARRWYAWWVVWRQKQTAVPPNDSSAVGSLLGVVRRWEKHFVMGYTIDSRTTYEIWYNTFNSSFSVHDLNGNPVADSVPTVRQAVHALFTMVAKVSNTDAKFINKVGASVDRVFDATLNQKAADAERSAEKEATQKEKEQSKKTKSAIGNIVSKVKNSEAWKTFKANNYKDPEENKNTDYTKQKTGSGAAARRDSDLRQRVAASIDTHPYGGWNRSPERDTYEPHRWDDPVDVDPQRASKPYKQKPFNPGWSASIDISESIDIILSERVELSGEELLDATENPLYSREANQRAEVAMKQADNSMTKAMLSQDIIGSVEQYNKTKINTRPSAFKRTLLKMFPFLRGRKAHIETPVDTKSLIGLPSRVRGRLHGVDVRADFITGFSLGSLDLEVWYVQELDLYDSSNLRKSFSVSKQKASYYVYDVKSQQLIQSDIPYYRLALQVVFLKMGAPVSDFG